MGLALLAAPLRPADAACSISATAVSFGSYNVFASAPLDSTGSVSYQCTILTPAVTITLDRGGASSFTPRRMLRGTQALTYNLYLDPSRLVIWGDGTGGTQTYTALLPLPQNIVVPVYGRVPSGQDVAVGVYADTITATILF
jgi:spore coat protein U-like protein